MEDTVNKLEAMFNKAESEIDYITRKVDVECANLTDGTSNVNPAEVVRRLKDIKKEYADIVKETQDIQKAQQEAACFFRDQLAGLCSTLSTLQQQTSATEQSDTSSELQQLEGLLGVTMAAKPVCGAVGDGQPPVSESPPSPATQPGSSKQTQPQTERVCEEGSAERRAAGAGFVEVDEQEFQSVSSLIRGKVKRTEVNQTYRILWQHFKEEGNRSPLSPADMYKMGLRVTGQTGEAKLKVLRALKLLNLSRKGEVTLT